MSLRPRSRCEMPKSPCDFSLLLHLLHLRPIYLWQDSATSKPCLLCVPGLCKSDLPCAEFASPTSTLILQRHPAMLQSWPNSKLGWHRWRRQCSRRARMATRAASTTVPHWTSIRLPTEDSLDHCALKEDRAHPHPHHRGQDHQGQRRQRAWRSAGVGRLASSPPRSRSGVWSAWRPVAPRSRTAGLSIARLVQLACSAMVAGNYGQSTPQKSLPRARVAPGSL